MDANDVATTSEQEQMVDPQIVRMRQEHEAELEGLTLTKRPAALLKYFTIGASQKIGRICNHVARHRLYILLTTGFLLIAGSLLYALDGPHEMYVKESLAYFQYGVWWIVLGVASSIGLGSGLHTFILYLGPHVTAFTMRATECGRVDLKSAPYDTPQWWTIHSTWASKNCSQLGSPQYPLLASHHSERYMVPLHAILMQVQLETILWGIGTALGELPPYFVSRAARLSGERPKELEEQLVSNAQSFGARLVQKLKLWMVNHFENFGFFTILLLASVPNPMFDLAGILCGQFLVPFWKFFAATLIGKAMVKTHLQTSFVIMACNPYVLELVGDGLTWLITHLPGVEYFSPSIKGGLERVKAKLHNSHSAAKAPPQGSATATVWNTIVFLVMVGFASSIIKSVAHNVLRERQSRELNALQARLQDASSSPLGHEPNGQ